MSMLKVYARFANEADISDPKVYGWHGKSRKKPQSLYSLSLINVDPLRG